MDFLILKGLSSRQRFQSLYGLVPQDMLTPETRIMLAWFQVYFSVYPEHDQVKPGVLESLIRIRSAGANPDSLAVTVQYCEQLKKPVSESDLKGVLSTLYELDFAGQAGALLSEYNRGGDVDIIHELEVIARKAKQSKASGRASDYITTSVWDILERTSDGKGIKFRRHPGLFESVGGLQGGDSLAIAAFVDAGKTSLLADMVTDWAPQCVEFFGADRPILWLNNEGRGEEIIPRLRQAALGVNRATLTDMARAGTIDDAYCKAIGADLDYIRVKDVHGASMVSIEQVIEDMRPSVVICDMMASVKMHMAKGSNKTDSVEGAWQEWREILVRHDCIGVGTIQLSVEGTNLLYPPLTSLKDTKIGAQGAMDVAIIMGSLLSNPDMRNLRGISTPKNKRAIPGAPGYSMHECMFDAEICRFNYGTVAVGNPTFTGVAAPAANMA